MEKFILRSQKAIEQFLMKKPRTLQDRQVLCESMLKDVEEMTIRRLERIKTHGKEQ